MARRTDRGQSPRLTWTHRSLPCNQSHTYIPHICNLRCPSKDSRCYSADNTCPSRDCSHSAVLSTHSGKHTLRNRSKLGLVHHTPNHHIAGNPRTRRTVPFCPCNNDTVHKYTCPFQSTRVHRWSHWIDSHRSWAGDSSSPTVCPLWTRSCRTHKSCHHDLPHRSTSRTHNPQHWNTRHCWAPSSPPAGSHIAHGSPVRCLLPRTDSILQCGSVVSVIDQRKRFKYSLNILK